MKIRKASMADAKAIQRIARNIKLPGADWPDWHTLRVIRELISEGRYYVAEIAHEVVGILGVASSCARFRGRVEAALVTGHCQKYAAGGSFTQWEVGR